MQVRVWARPDLIEGAEFALMVAVGVQEWLGEYVGMCGPVQKMGEPIPLHV